MLPGVTSSIDEPYVTIYKSLGDDTELNAGALAEVREELADVLKNLPTLISSHQHSLPERLVYNALMLAACIRDPQFTPLLENLKSSEEVMNTSWSGVLAGYALQIALENNQVAQ